MGRNDLKGPWTGVYHYPDGPYSTPFLVSLRQSGGSISGHIEEPDNYGAFGVDIVYATFDGETAGDAIAFVKTYENAPIDQPPVQYAGTISSDRRRVEGQWIIPGYWSGRFEMSRACNDESRSVERTEAVEG